MKQNSESTITDLQMYDCVKKKLTLQCLHEERNGVFLGLKWNCNGDALFGCQIENVLFVLLFKARAN